MGDDTTEQKRRRTNPKYKTSYSRVTMEEAERRLGFMMDTFESHAIMVSHMLAEAKTKSEGLERDEIQETKAKVYDRIVEFLEGEGYPTEANEDFKEANVNDLVFAIIIPIITAFRRKTRRNLRLRREKEIIAVDSETGGYQEFIMMDLIGVGSKKFVFVVEAKKSSVGEAKKQCLLAMKDMGENNGQGVVYGFVTTGEHWQMIRYDGTTFSQTENFPVLFRSMGEEKEKWMKGASIIVDCIHTALCCGGIGET